MGWTLYKHISPSGKIYVGISSNLKNRWAAKGYYYTLSDTIFCRALKKYGWENFKHLVIEEDLTKKEACAKEQELIRLYKAKNISYNITNGGEGYTGQHSKRHIENRVAARVRNNNTDYLVIDSDFNYLVCDTQREAAEFLDGTQSNISHTLRQPIGYTFRKHYIWKHKKGTPVNIDEIKSKIQHALQLRKARQSQLTKERSKELVALSKAARGIKY